MVCKTANDDPIERYALPNENKIKWTFHIRHKSSDILQSGIVQTSNGKQGGGKEVYFESATFKDTYLKTTPY